LLSAATFLPAALPFAGGGDPTPESTGSVKPLAIAESVEHTLRRGWNPGLRETTVLLMAVGVSRLGPGKATLELHLWMPPLEVNPVKQEVIPDK